MHDMKLLKKHGLFEPISDHELREIARIAKEKKYNCNQIIFNVGEKGDSLYFIKRGTVEISIPIEGTKQYKRVAVLHQGEFFGELSFLDGREHSARAKAIEDIELLVINNKDYQNHVIEDKRAEIEMEIKMVLKVIEALRNMNREYSLRPFA
jgi:CRP-like cAMP-binding protein